MVPLRRELLNGQLKCCHLDQLRHRESKSAPTEMPDSPPEEVDLLCIPEVVNAPLPIWDHRSPSPVVRTYPTRPNRGRPPDRYKPGTS